MTLPKDSVILLSFINTKLRDFNSSLDDFCVENDVRKELIVDRLSVIGYHYDSLKNQFV